MIIYQVKDHPDFLVWAQLAFIVRYPTLTTRFVPMSIHKKAWVESSEFFNERSVSVREVYDNKTML